MLDWDAEAHCCSTTSLHYLEGEAALRQGRTSFPQGPQIVTDPQVSTPVQQTPNVITCCALSGAILPFLQALTSRKPVIRCQAPRQ